MKNWNKYPLAILLLLSSILFAAAGLAGRHTVYASYDRQDIMTPSLALVFQGWKDGIYPWDLLQASEAEDVFNDEPEIAGNDAPAAEPEQFISGNSLLQDQLETVRGAGENIVPDVSGNGTILPNTLAPVKESETDGGTDSGVLAAAGSLSDNQISVTDGTDQTAESGNPTDGADAFEKENGQIGEHISEEAVLPEQQEDQTYEFTAVGEDYFSDALFIGDSRTVGLQEYGKIDQAQYYAATSLTIYNVFQKPKKVAVLDGKKMTIEEALGQKQYKKIYLMLGINELGQDLWSISLKLMPMSLFVSGRCSPMQFCSCRVS